MKINYGKNKMRKFVLGVGSLSAVVTPVASIVACGTTNPTDNSWSTEPPKVTKPLDKTAHTTVKTPVVDTHVDPSVALNASKDSAIKVFEAAAQVAPTALSDTSKTPDAGLTAALANTLAAAKTAISAATVDNVSAIQAKETEKINAALKALSDSNELTNLKDAAIAEINGVSTTPAVHLTSGNEDTALKGKITSAISDAKSAINNATLLTIEDVKRDEKAKIVLAVHELSESNDSANSLALAIANFGSEHTKEINEIPNYHSPVVVTPLTDTTNYSEDAALKAKVATAKADALKNITDVTTAQGLVDAVEAGHKAIDTALSNLNDSNVFKNQIKTAKDSINALVTGANVFTAPTTGTINKDHVNTLVTDALAAIDNCSDKAALDIALDAQTNNVKHGIKVLNLATAQANGIARITAIAAGTYVQPDNGVLDKGPVNTAVLNGTNAVNNADADSLPGVLTIQEGIVREALATLNLATAQANGNAVIDSLTDGSKIHTLNSGILNRTKLDKLIADAKTAIEDASESELPGIITAKGSLISEELIALNAATDTTNKPVIVDTERNFFTGKYFHSDKILQTIHIPDAKWNMKGADRGGSYTPMNAKIKGEIDKIMAARNAEPIWNWHTMGDPYVDAINNVRYVLWKSAQDGQIDIRHTLRDLSWDLIPHFKRINGVDPTPAYGYTGPDWAPFWTKATKDINDYLASDDKDAQIQSFHNVRMVNGQKRGYDGWLRDEKAMRMDALLMQSAQWRVQAVEYKGSFDGHRWQETNDHVLVGPDASLPRASGNISPNKLVYNNRHKNGTTHENGYGNVGGGENYVGFVDLPTQSMESLQHKANPFGKNVYDAMLTAISVLYDSNDATKSMGHRRNFYYPDTDGIGYSASSPGYLDPQWTDTRKVNTAVLTITRNEQQWAGPYQIWTQAHADDVKAKYAWIEQVFGKQMFNMFVFNMFEQFRDFYHWIFPAELGELNTSGEDIGKHKGVHFIMSAPGYDEDTMYLKIQKIMMDYNTANPGKLDVAKFIELIRGAPSTDWIRDTAIGLDAIKSPANVRMTSLKLNIAPYRKVPVTNFIVATKPFDWNGGGSQAIYHFGSADLDTIKQYFTIDVFS